MVVRSAEMVSAASSARTPTGGDAAPHRGGSAARGEGEASVRVRAFRIHAVVFAAGMSLIVLANALTNLAAGIAGNRWAWWSAWALIGWGAGLTVHALVLWVASPHRSTSSRAIPSSVAPSSATPSGARSADDPAATTSAASPAVAPDSTATSSRRVGR